MTMTIAAHTSTSRDGISRRTGARGTDRDRGSRRLTSFVWMVLLTASVITIGLVPTARDRVPASQTSTIAVRVSRADTLWSIAASHRLPGTSTARMVELISQANSLPQGGVYAGAVLRIPAQPETSGSYAQAGDPPATE